MISWQEAKDTLDYMKFPDDENGWKEERGDIFHSDKKKIHPLLAYRKRLKDIGGFEVVAYYNICPDCHQIRNKNITIFNKDENTCYQKVFVERAREDEPKDILSKAADFFSAFIFLAI